MFSTGFGGEAGETYLNDLAAKMFRATVMASLPARPSKASGKKSKAASLASRSTASGGASVSGRSIASARSVRSSRVDLDQLASRAADGATATALAVRPSPPQIATSVGADTPATAARSAAAPRAAPREPTGRFLDLLEDVEGACDSDEEMAKAPEMCGRGSSSTDALLPAPHAGELAGDRRLQSVIRWLSRKELCDIDDFALAVADPSFKGCPLVVCSEGFASLTGHSRAEALGAPLRPLLLSEGRGRARDELHAIRAAAARGAWYPGDGRPGVALLSDDLGPEADAEAPQLPEGELVCVQEVSTKFGQPTRCVLHFKQVELDDVMLLLCLLAKVPDPEVSPEEHDRDADAQNRVHLAFNRVSQKMDLALQVLAAQFWVLTAMRRQTAADDTDGGAEE